jgi:hypothetical protein
MKSTTRCGTIGRKNNILCKKFAIGARTQEVYTSINLPRKPDQTANDSAKPARPVIFSNAPIMNKNQFTSHILPSCATDIDG